MRMRRWTSRLAVRVRTTMPGAALVVHDATGLCAPSSSTTQSRQPPKGSRAGVVAQGRDLLAVPLGDLVQGLAA